MPKDRRKLDFYDQKPIVIGKQALRTNTSNTSSAKLVSLRSALNLDPDFKTHRSTQKCQKSPKG